MQRPHSNKFISWIFTAVILISFAFAAGLSGEDDSADLPGPDTDRVGFPKDYRTYTILRKFTTDENPRVITVYANEAAASVSSLNQLPYPNGSIIVVEYARPATSSNQTQTMGMMEAGEVFRLDVMRREKGFGEAYGPNRTAEWEYVAYLPDGTHLIPPSKSGKCAACHLKAGSKRDFVYRGRFPEDQAPTNAGN